jgi:preprotein translocase subunit SecG
LVQVRKAEGKAMDTGYILLALVVAAAAVVVWWLFKTQGLLIAGGSAMAAVVVWFLLTFLFQLAPWIALPLLLLTAVFLIGLVLVQRGKGGGLAGALGGMGGQSAFGTKAGDLFTRVTIGAALFWIVLCMAAVNVLGTGTGTSLLQGLGRGAGRPATQDSLPAPDNHGGGDSTPAPAGGDENPEG